MKPRIGDPAPDFSLPSSEGNVVNLSDYKGKKKVILYFYPKDDTPGCTREACTFRDRVKEFGEADAEILGVSFDGKNSHEKFMKKYSLPFTLLSDERKEVAGAYDAIGVIGLSARRVTYVIDKDGVIRYIAEGISPEMHVEEALRVAKSL